jgi:hypothetical protein
MLSALPRPMQLAQATVQRFDLLLVCVLLAFRQLQRLQHLVHIIQGCPERLDDPRDLFDGALNSRRGRRVPLPGRGQGRFPLGWGRLRNRRSRFGHFCPWRWRDQRRRCRRPPPAASVPPTTPSATPARLRRLGRLRDCGFWFGFLVGSHAFFKVHRSAANARANVRPRYTTILLIGLI